MIDEHHSGTEGIGATWATPDQWLDHPGTVGQALIGTVQICDDDGNVLPPGEIGSVYFVSDGPLFEYHGAPEKTKAARHPANERASTLGDIGYLDEDGFLFLTDRKAFMIISGGVNIYPQEIEDGGRAPSRAGRCRRRPGSPTT
ncbi:MAG: AMP-binding protein [Acidimicrobiia bacterium]|nr:AMP-binding protein [Acidimicrobiia bacterium]